MGRLWIGFIAFSALLAACGEPDPATTGAGGPPSPDVPAVLEIVCHEDGSTELLDTDVRAQPDGVHMRVDNRAGEFVSINGAGLDFSEGVTEQTARTAPGEVKVACWPGSKHTEPEPERQAVRIHDPDGYWVHAEMECPRDPAIAETIIDYADDGSGAQGNPEDLARDDLKGLEPDDEISTVGYPEAEPRQIAVERNEETVALLSYGAAQKGGWYLSSYSTCGSSDLSIPY